MLKPDDPWPGRSLILKLSQIENSTEACHTSWKKVTHGSGEAPFHEYGIISVDSSTMYLGKINAVHILCTKH